MLLLVRVLLLHNTVRTSSSCCPPKPHTTTCSRFNWLSASLFIHSHSTHTHQNRGLPSQTRQSIPTLQGREGPLTTPSSRTHITAAFWCLKNQYKYMDLDRQLAQGPQPPAPPACTRARGACLLSALRSVVVNGRPRPMVDRSITDHAQRPPQRLVHAPTTRHSGRPYQLAHQSTNQSQALGLVAGAQPALGVVAHVVEDAQLLACGWFFVVRSSGGRVSEGLSRLYSNTHIHKEEGSGGRGERDERKRGLLIRSACTHRGRGPSSRRRRAPCSFRASPGAGTGGGLDGAFDVSCGDQWIERGREGGRPMNYMRMDVANPTTNQPTNQPTRKSGPSFLHFLLLLISPTWSSSAIKSTW